jgi:hypothetical protein
MNSLATDAALRVLLVEDDANDAELLLERLREDGLVLEARQVDTEDDFREALAQFEPDIVISDLSMPMFSGGSPGPAATLSTARFSASRLALACSRKTSASGVIAAPLRPRVNSLVPRISSSSFIVLVTAGWVIDRACAAPPRVPVRTMARKHWRWRSRMRERAVLDGMSCKHATHSEVHAPNRSNRTLTRPNPIEHSRPGSAYF